MNDNSSDAIVPIAPESRCAISVRLATVADMPFVDELQKMHSHMVGWFPRKQMEAYIESNDVLIAEDEHKAPIGYCVSRDRYSGRDDVGIIYQLNVRPISQRNLIGATLVKAVFEKAAYGCKLFCCWCAQDIRANMFWESIGFVPLAFRTGSRGKQRVHIFWQRRVREDDGGPGAAYWFPSQTHAGAVREDRLVLPIPPSTHWRDAMPLVLPELPEAGKGEASSHALCGKKKDKPRVTTSRKMAIVRSKSKHLQGLPPGKAAVVTAGGLRYIDRGDYEPEPEPVKAKRPRKARGKHEPKLIAAARELRDRFLEQVNERGLLPESWTRGKYDVSRSRKLEAREADVAAEQWRLLGERAA